MNSQTQPFLISFAQSPNRQVLQSSQHEPMHKITINLPEFFVESTTDYCSSSLHSSVKQQKEEENIRVYCRFKPCVGMQNVKYDHTMIEDYENKYSFDSIFSDKTTQNQIFKTVSRRHINSFFRGQNSTLFTYGQTGSGKTYTMFGNLKDNKDYGLIPRTLQQIFKRKGQQQLTCSILQIYNERLIDLFDPLRQADGIKLKEAGESVVLQGLVEVKVETHHEIMDLIRFAYKDRKTASTYNNDCSSRSHTILFLYREIKQIRTKLCFIDLAGSEKVRKSGVQGMALEQAKKINLSLSCLGNVVSALTTGADHIPYRNSKLTRILKDSLTGGCMTSIITTCSLDKTDYSETISTIKFAVRAKRIKNKKRLSNVQISNQEVIINLKKELQQAKKELEQIKKRNQQFQVTTEEIPEEEPILRPIKSSTVYRATNSGMSHSYSESEAS